jgi:hypothetical protein
VHDVSISSAIAFRLPVIAGRSALWQRFPACLPYALVAALIAGLIASLATFSALQEMQRYRDRASVATRNMARLLDQNVSSGFDRIDIVLQSVVAHYSEVAALGRIDAARLDAYLAKRESLIPEASLRLTDKDGNLHYGRRLRSEPVNISDRDFFVRLRDDPKAGLVVAGPMLTRISNRWVIGLARRISAADGSFAGIVYAYIGTEHFHEVLSSLALGSAGAATLRTADLTLVHRHPHTDAAEGSTNVSPQLRTIIAAEAGEGEYIAVTALDGIERGNAFRKLARYPFYVIVGLNTDDQAAQWKSNVATLSGLAVLAILLTGLTAFLFYRNARRQAADIEARKAIEVGLREAQRELLAVQRLGHAGYWSWDLETGTHNWSEEIFAIYGRPPDLGAASYAEDRSYFTAPSWELIRSAVEKCLADGASYACDAEVIRPDGTRRWVVIFGEAVRNSAGAIVKLRGTVQDISERKLAEAELEQHRHHLESLVEHRTAALSIAKDAAEAANRAKTTFLSNMSHELRTPLNGMMGMTTIALRGTTDPVKIDQLGKALQSAERLLGIVNNLLDITWIESERFHLASADFALGEVIERLARLVGPNATQKNLALVVDIAPELLAQPLHGDAVHLGQLLGHLLNNAVKFTNYGRVSLHVFVAEDSASSVLLRFEIRDTGIGISAENQKRLFSAFEQADNSMTRKHGGTGLGLAISKRLALAMGGAIGVESEPGFGSLFWFTARLSRATDVASIPPEKITVAAESELKARFSGSRILLAEDEPINQELTRLLMADAGLRVDLADNGAEAVEMAKETDYALIVMDLRMPVLNGVEATWLIRTLPGRARTPILALTASVFNKDSEKCFSAGMSDFIAKPVNPEALFATLLKWLDRDSRQGSAERADAVISAQA